VILDDPAVSAGGNRGDKKVDKGDEEACCTKVHHLFPHNSGGSSLRLTGLETVEWVSQKLRESTGHPLYDAQKEALKKILEKPRGIIQMPTGAGKTRLAAATLLALYHKGSIQKGDIVLYFTPRRVIREQAVKEFEEKSLEKVSDPPFFVYSVDDEGKSTASELLNNLLTTGPSLAGKSGIGVYVLTPQLLNHYSNVIESTLDKFKRVKVVILDEVHHTYWGNEISDKIVSLLKLSDVKFVMGLSATPVKEAVDNVGEIIYSLSSSKAMEMGILARKLKIYSTMTFTRIPESYLKSDKWWAAVKDRDIQWKFAVIERAEKYAQEIVEKLGKEVGSLNQRVPKTLVVAANTKEADRLKEFLIKEIDNRGREDPENLVYVAHYKEDEPIEVINQFKAKKEGVLITVNMADIGFDDPNLEVLVIARAIETPVGYVQIRGRVLRKPTNSQNLKETRYALIIDLTGAAKHEKYVEEVELGKYAQKIKSEKLKRDLMGKGDVPEISGEVKIGEYKIIEIPPTDTPTDTSHRKSAYVKIIIDQEENTCTIEEFPAKLNALLKKHYSVNSFRILFSPGLRRSIEEIIKRNFRGWMPSIEKSHEGITVIKIKD
jgi:superfamily II DNA or RNA helicase